MNNHQSIIPMSSYSPIIISSPVRRSGTTLVQRLLCSASNALIYGETAANELSMLVNLLIMKQYQFQHGLKSRDEILEKVLMGNTEEWIADLLPPIQPYINAIPKAYLSIFDHFQQFAEEQARPIWGVKMAEWPVQNLIHVMQTLPAAKLIYIHRSLADCVRSSKSIQTIQTLDDLKAFSNAWLQQYHYIQQHAQQERCLIIRYEDLVNTPDIQLLKLESFTGAKGIKKEVLQRKINTFTYDKQGDPSGKGYLKPGDLSKEELEIIALYEAEKEKIFLKIQEK